MLSRNNHQEQFKKYEPKKQRFTIKKLSVGVASVLLGISFAKVYQLIQLMLMQMPILIMVMVQNKPTTI